MTKDEALRLALEALKKSVKFVSGSHDPVGSELDDINEAITAIKAALEAKDDPWEKFCDSHCVWTDHHPDCKLAQRTWVALTDEEREQVINANTATGLWHMAKDIEAKLKEKNT